MDKPYIKYILRDKKFPTIISFSSINTPKGKFTPYRILVENTNEYNVIFVNDERNNWYQNGVSGISSDSQKAAQELVARDRNSVMGM